MTSSNHLFFPPSSFTSVTVSTHMGQSIACFQLKMYSFSSSSLLLYFLFSLLATFRCPCTGSTCPSCVAHLDVGPTSARPPARPWTPCPSAHLTLPVGPAHKPCPSLHGHLTWHLVIECPCPMPTSSTTTTTTTTSAHAVQCQCICPRQQWPRAVCPTSYCLTAWLEQWNTCLW